MAEVQTTTESGEMTQRFIEFVMMQAQHASFALGQIPHPHTGKGEVRLEMAKLLIDQLAMIRAKTRGNLSSEELGILNNALSSLQLAFAEVGGTAPAAANPSQMSDAPVAQDQPETGKAEADGAKKFTKSYGA